MVFALETQHGKPLEWGCRIEEMVIVHKDETELITRLESMLGGTVVRLKVRRVDLVNDSTVVDVRYRMNSD